MCAGGVNVCVYVEAGGVCVSISVSVKLLVL